MNDQPREVPERADQPTEQLPEAAAGQEKPAAPGTSEPAPAPGAADETAVHGEQPPPAPPTPQLSQPHGAWTPPPPPPRQPGGFRRFAGHRATQLVGVGLLGALIGGGIVGGIAAASHHGPRDGRPGIHRQYDGNQGFPGRGPGQHRYGDGG
jgi:hypothetical protein